jgi:hypothetical protein
LVARLPADRPDEFHLRALAKRFDLLRGPGQRWEGHEYLRSTAGGLHKRYPPGHGPELEVTLLKEPVSTGTRWRDAQGECELTLHAESCPGPRGELPACATVVCRLGAPTATIVTSTYARGVGMVRQEVRVLQLMPNLYGAGIVLPPGEGKSGSRSLLRLTGYRVARP